MVGLHIYKHLRLALRAAASQLQDAKAMPRERALETLGFPFQQCHLSKGRWDDKRKVFLNLILTSKEKPPGCGGDGNLGRK